MIKQADFILSPMNYVGGKSKLLSQIVPIFPKTINRFVDLFCGGLSVGVNVDAKKVIANDNLSFLIAFYQALKINASWSVLSHIESRIEAFGLSKENRDAYLNFREFYNSQKNPLDLFVLMAYSFNHQIRFNSKHNFNTPFGKNRSGYNPKMKLNLLCFMEKIRSSNIEFKNCSFDDFCFKELDRNDFVYADPPYLITRGTYNDGKRGFTGWGEKEEKRLLSILEELNSRKIRFALSNVLRHKGKTNNLLLDWIEKNGYKIHYLAKNYANCNYHTKNRSIASTKEVLITNY